MNLQRTLQSPRWIWSWTLLGLLVRVVLILRVDGQLQFYDERDYQEIAVALMNGEGFVLRGAPTAFRTPAEPLLLAGVYEVTGPDPCFGEIAGAFLLCLVPFAIAAIARRVWRHPLLPPLAAAISAMHPGLAYASASLYPTVLTATLLACGIAVFQSAMDSPTPLRGATSGALLGCAGLASTYLAPLPLVAAFLLRKHGRAAIALVIAGLVPLGAWGLRNAYALGEPVLATHGGYNLALGANDRASPLSGNWIEPDPLSSTTRSDELSRDHAWSQKAYQWISNHPLRWATLAVARGVLTLDSVGNPRTQGAHSNWLARVIGWMLLPWILLGVGGLITERHSSAAKLTASAFALVVFACAMTIVKPRFRFPLDPLLAIFAVACVLRILDRWNRKRARARVNLSMNTNEET